MTVFQIGEILSNSQVGRISASGTSSGWKKGLGADAISWTFVMMEAPGTVRLARRSVR